MPKLHRIDQLLSSLGYCARSEARDWCRAGQVALDGQPVRDPSTKVDPTRLTVEGEPLDHPEGVFVILHKPLGHVCSHDFSEGPRVFDLLPERWQGRNPPVASVGRLDKETSGVLLLTDIPGVVHALTSPKKKVEKTYVATLDRPPPPEAADRLASGTLLLEGEEKPCLPATLRVLGERTVEVTLTEGRYHQVRRMWAALGCAVLTLHRTRFGPYTADDLAPGHWRLAAPIEV